MNFAIRTRQLARVFVDAQSVNVDPPVGGELLKNVSLSEKLGGVALSQVPLIDQASGGLIRWALVSPKLDWQIGLLSQSFDLSRLGTDLEGTNIGDFGDFARRAADVLWGCADYFGRMPHRLVLVQSGMLRELPPGEDAVAGRLLRLPASFEKPGPFEWDWRCCRHGRVRLGGRDEETNVVATLKRATGTLQILGGNERLQFDRIQVELDVNTSPTNTRGRFREVEVREFFVAAIQEHARLSAELTAFALQDS